MKRTRTKKLTMIILWMLASARELVALSQDSPTVLSVCEDIAVSTGRSLYDVYQHSMRTENTMGISLVTVAVAKAEAQS